ncbi:MAG: hypothetical protein ACRET4_03210 [Steroidobacteraceae bacterium]
MLAILISTVAGAAIALIAHVLPKDSPAPKRRSRASFRAVSIVPAGGSCCPTCDELRHRRFLLEEAPKLPLAHCTAPECLCHYRHHSDRRQYNPGRRVRDVGQPNPQFDGSERRLWDVSRRRRSSRRLIRA